MLEVFNNLFMSIAEQMGVSLQNTAYSVNIKERLDFSCAVFAADGTLVANAPHMPVHLGSMDRAVETIIRENQGRIAPGDVYVINAPYNGGTHLPDITVCTPVYDDDPAARSCSGSRRAVTTPTSAASRRARCRRTPPPSRKRASCSTTSRSSTAAISGEGARRRPDRREISRAQPAAERQRHEGADRRQREGRAGTAQDGGAFHAAGGRSLHAARAGQRRRERAPRHRPAARQRVRLSDGPGHLDQGQDHASTRRSARRPSTSPAPRRSSRPTSTRPSR